ncbi:MULTISPECIES: FCD domain-containing protein [unclassified Rhodococcus (in: high G+C Gram-positive bacteria)]|uniref:FadR/GntR family transcriptional regulator n=1 Tax=Rhodococcus sp. SJ-3 TaxID=3454628 RepID=UPI003F7A9D22
MMSPVGSAAHALRHIEQLLGEGAYLPGDRLPTERELAATTGLGRNAVREALHHLADAGIVTRHVGRGTFLSTTHTPEVEANAPSPSDIMAARLTIEPSLMPAVVLAASGADLAELEKFLREGENAASASEFEQWDVRFHHGLAAATHNEVLIGVSRYLVRCRQKPIWGSLKSRTFSTDTRDAYCAEHAAILNAVKDRDPDAAAEHMRSHLVHVQRTLTDLRHQPHAGRRVRPLTDR